MHALQGAWSAIHRTPVPADNPAAGVFAAQQLQHALAEAVRGGHDTDTVAAIAGGLLGARWGATAVPAAWRRSLHGWPGLRARDLVELADRITGGTPFTGDYNNWGDLSALASHPHDEDLWLGGVAAACDLPEGVEVVVSLCRMRTEDRHDGIEHIDVRLIDNPDPAENPNLGFVVHDTVRMLEALRAEGRTVLLHCVQAQSRTPTLAALYGARRTGKKATEALADVLLVLPRARPNEAFLRILEETT